MTDFGYRGQFEYDLILSCDLNTIRHTQWYYFRVQNAVPGVTYLMRIVNLSKKDSLYNHGELVTSETKHIISTPIFNACAIFASVLNHSNCGNFQACGLCYTRKLMPTQKRLAGAEWDTTSGLSAALIRIRVDVHPLVPVKNSCL